MTARVDTSGPKIQRSEEPGVDPTTPLTASKPPSSLRKQLSDASRGNTHIVRSGDTVWGIAHEAGVDYRAVLKLNGLTEETARNLAVGATLRLPQATETRPHNDRERAPHTHQVKSGESIWKIASHYGCDYQKLLQINGLTEDSARRLQGGTKLVLPSGAGHTSTNEREHSFEVTDKTRDQLHRGSKRGDRLISLDFNDVRNARVKGIEIVIPDDATKEERRAAEAYVKGVQAFFKSHGLERPIRGVRTRSEAGRGVPGQFHTEPFFLKDQEALRVMQQDTQGYIDVVAATLGTIKGATFMPPHKKNDPGASKGKLNERDFAKKMLIPLLREV